MPKSAENQIKRQGGAARYRTVKSGGKTMTCAVTRKPGPKGGKTVCWNKESRDDIDKLPLPPEAKSYARGKGMKFLKAKPQNYIDMVAAVTNQKDRKKGFGNQDAGETTSGSKLEALHIVHALIYG